MVIVGVGGFSESLEVITKSIENVDMLKGLNFCRYSDGLGTGLLVSRISPARLWRRFPSQYCSCASRISMTDDSVSGGRGGGLLWHCVLFNNNPALAGQNQNSERVFIELAQIPA